MHSSLQRLIDCAIEATRGTARPVVTLSDLADRLAESPQTINNWRTRGVSQSGALKAESAFGCSPMFIREGAGVAFGATPIQAPAQSLMAQPVSLQAVQTVPSITWEQIKMSVGKDGLPPVFRVQMVDNAMAPRAGAGAWVQFSSTETARPGDGVLVRDALGNPYFRQYRAGRPGCWEAHADNSAFASLDSERDGLEVLAVLMAVEARWG